MEHKRIESLDILRALALIMISIYHWFGYMGTYIGVIIFFVLSGYLFSTNEYFHPKGIINGIRNRISKLYPSLILVILFTTISLYLLNNKEGLELIYKSSIIFSLLGFNNIFQIKSNLSYFDNYSVVLPLTHIWALSFQFQMYLIIPFIFKLLRGINIKKNITVFILIVCSMISAIVMAFYFFKGYDFSRIYYGTDSRLFSFFIASAVGIYYGDKHIKNKWEKVVITILAFLGIMITIYFVIFIDYKNSLNYYGLMYLTSILLSFTVVFFTKKKRLILDILWIKKLLTPIIKLGQHQYEYYLWQYPIMIIFREIFKFSSISFNNQVIFQIIFLIILSEFTHFIVKNFDKKAISFTALGMIISILWIVPNYINKDLEKMKEIQNQKNTEISISNIIETEKIKNITEETPKDLNENYDDINKNVTLTNNLIDNRKILFIGDSVMKMAQNDILKIYPNSKLDAEVGRQFHQLPELLNKYKSEGNLPEIVVVSLGTNGAISQRDEKKIIEILKENEVYFLNVVVPKSWENNVNTRLKILSNENINFHLIDWYSFAKGKKEYFYRDGVHPVEKAAKKYAELIFQGVSK